MTRSRQQEFQGEGFKKPNDCFGGSLLKNSHAKVKRPLASTFPLHLVLRTHKSHFRLPRHYRKVNDLVVNTCAKHGVRLYKYANVGNHIHLLIKLPNIQRWSAYIRELTGQIAQLVQGLKAQDKGDAFWKQRPFTRIVRGWKQAFHKVIDYLELNRLEGDGFIDRAQTKTLKDLRAFFADG
jgi:REP element-mobilizing transposase RayT